MFSPSALRATLCISECIVREEIKPKKKKSQTVRELRLRLQQGS